jgi:lipopolysaccharide biosynthesis regulator YciM
MHAFHQQRELSTMSERTPPPPPPPAAKRSKDETEPLVIAPAGEAAKVAAAEPDLDATEIEEVEQLEVTALEEIEADAGGVVELDAESEHVELEAEPEHVELDAEPEHVELEAEPEHVELEAEPGDEGQASVSGQIETVSSAPLKGDAETASLRRFYLSEAEVLAARQPERAAMMWLEAAELGAVAGAPTDEVVADLERALELRSESMWLLPRARRLLMRLGEHERAIKLGQREVKLGGDTHGRAAVLLESAALLYHVIDKSDLALRMLDGALALHPGQVFALRRAIELRREQGDFAGAAAGLEQLAEHLSDPAQRAVALHGAGTLHESVLQDIEAAKRAYQRAAEADAQNVPVCIALCDVYRQTGDVANLARSLEHLADLLETPAFRGRLLRLAGMLHMDVAEDLDSASRALIRASRATPEDAAVWTALAQAQVARGRPREAIESLRRLLGLTVDKEGRAALLTQIAQLHAQLHEPERAIAANRDALEEVESYLPALQALGKLYRQRGDYESLIAIAQPETEGLLPAEARAVRCLDLADVLAQRLERPEEAVAMCRRAIDLAPRFHLAYWALERLLERLELHDDLAALYGKHADVCADPQTRADRQLRRGRLEAGPLGRPERALELLEQLDEQVLRGAVFERISLYEKTERHAELVDLLLAQAEATSDDEEREGRRVQAALLLEQRLGEPDRALEIYREVIEQNASSYAAIHGTGRILHGMGRWGDLVRLHHHELTIEPERPDAPVLLSRVGRILEQELGNAGAAIGAYSKALKRDPSYTPALAALDRLARGEKRWADYVDVLERHAEARGALPARRGEAAAALVRGGDVATWVLGALDRAAELYGRALELDADNRMARDGLAQVRQRQEEWTDAAMALDELAGGAEAAEEQAALGLCQARIVERRLGDPPELERYDAASRASFGGQLAEELLRVLRQLRSSRAPQLQVEIGREATDARLGAAHLLGVAHELEFAASSIDASAAGELACAARLAHERQPDDPAVLWCYQRQLYQARDAAGLAALHEHEAQLELDRTLRVQALTRAGEAHLAAGAVEHAERQANEALNFDGRCLPALQLLVEIAERNEDWIPLAGLLDRLAAASAAPQNRLAGCLRAAQIWQQRIGDTSRALASLAVALADNPAEASAFDQARQLLGERGEHDELSRLYQRRIRATDEPAAKGRLLRAHAQLLVDELGQADRAIAELDALLALVPDDAEALGQVATLHRERGHWSAAAGALERLVDSAAAEDVRHRARVDLAELWLKKLHEPQRARDVLARCEQERPGDEQTVRLRVELAAMVGDWHEAQQALDGLIDRSSADVSIRLWALLRRAEIARSGLHDEALADQSVAAALRLAKADEAALAALRTQCDTPEARTQLVQVAEGLVQEQEDLALRTLLGRLYVEDLDQRDEGAAHLAQVVAAEPGDRAVALLYARALEASQRRDAADRYRELGQHAESFVSACRGLVRCGSRGTALAAATLVELVGKAGDEERVQLTALGATLEDDAAPQGRVPQDSLRAADEGTLEQSLALLGPFIDELFELEQGDAASAELEQLVGALSSSLRLDAVAVRRVRGRQVVFVGGAEPRLLVGRELGKDPSAPWRRYAIGRALAMVGPHQVGLDALSTQQLEDLFTAIHEKRPPTDEQVALKKLYGKVVPRKTRKQLEQLGPPAELGKLGVYRASYAGYAERLALVLARHPGAVLRRLAGEREVELAPAALLADSRVSALLRFALSKDFSRLYNSVWT